MSLVITTYVPEGIVMASDSRQSMTIESKTPDGKSLSKINTINSDNVYKTYLLSRKDKNDKPIFEIGVQSFGQDLLGGISTASHIKRFSEEKLTDEDNVTTIPKKLVEFFRELFPTADTGFHVAGYKKEEKISVPYIYYCHISQNIIGNRKNVKSDGKLAYGATWSGQADIITGLINPIIAIDDKGNQKVIKPAPPIIWDAVSLQDAIDFSIFAIRTTIDAIRFQARPKNVGGPIDVLVITPDGSKWIQKKELRGE
ncbi:MAG: Uncharacterized protein XD85_0243 [Parcubacteria bacterium 34_609]|nr:MAG: Uncharacterized protein XD85_0243 [Parcubacteria bacterium 34_609]KUK98870.1 MAG: Uncharacterized protein XE08_0363 [Parcubacteria bacterium 32_520]